MSSQHCTYWAGQRWPPAIVIQRPSSIDAHFGALWIPNRERDSSSDPQYPIFHGTYAVQALVLSLGIKGTFGASPTPAPGVQTTTTTTTTVGSNDRTRP